MVVILECQGVRGRVLSYCSYVTLCRYIEIHLAMLHDIALCGAILNILGHILGRIVLQNLKRSHNTIGVVRLVVFLLI